MSGGALEDNINSLVIVRGAQGGKYIPGCGRLGVLVSNGPEGYEWVKKWVNYHSYVE